MRRGRRDKESSRSLTDLTLWTSEEANKQSSEEAHSTLNAADLKMPKGNMTLVTDNEGNEFTIPIPVINDPSNYQSDLRFNSFSKIQEGSSYKKRNESPMLV